MKPIIKIFLKEMHMKNISFIMCLSYLMMFSYMLKGMWGTAIVTVIIGIFVQELTRFIERSIE